MPGTRVLVVDDDADLRGLVRALLDRSGALVREAANGKEALRVLFEARPDVIVLDVNMPELDGWQTLERIRDMTEVPVVMLTARDAELEKVRGLQAGADDYVTKPFGKQELLARIGAVLRRATAARGHREREHYDDGLVRIDVPNADVHVAGEPLHLTPLEFRMLTTFVRNPEQVLNRDQLLEHVWGDSSHVAPEQVKLYVGYLRRKIEARTGKDAQPIETVRGFGYRYRRPRARAAA